MPQETLPWILASGVFNLALAIFHVAFWRLFGWPKSLVDSGIVNRGVTQILNLALTYLFVLSALLCLLFPVEMGATDLGRFWLFAMSGFWLVRALIQPLFFGLRHPVSLVLFAAFVLGAIIHAVAWASARGI
jgi:hypothetical protein